MKLGSPIPHKKARIEIIPLIDIMFFLLACFMVISLSMVQMRGMKINMPTASTATPETKNDFTTITVDYQEHISLEKVPVDLAGLLDGLRALQAKNPETRIYIRGDAGATHGIIVSVLDKVKAAGITKVAFEIRPMALSGGAASPQPGAGAPVPPPAPPHP